MSTAPARSQVLADMLSPNPAERSELLGAGVARATVDALYPPEFANLVHAVSELLLTHGLNHLHLEASPAERWEDQHALLDQLGFGMPEELQAAYWAEFETIFELAETREIYDAVRGYCTLMNRDVRTSHNMANRYLRSLFMGYWLLRHGVALNAAQADCETALSWIIDWQLPQLKERAHA